MSLHYILDGYNVIKRTDFLASLKLEDARNELVRFILNKRPHGSRRHKVTIVFDGKSGFYMNEPEGKAVEIIFAIKTNADQEIKRLIDRSNNARNLVIVTDDREIQSYAKTSRAQILGCREFMSRGTGSRNQSSKSGLSAEQEAAINRELEIEFGLTTDDDE